MLLSSTEISLAFQTELLLLLLKNIPAGIQGKPMLLELIELL